MAVLPQNKALFDRIVNSRLKQITPADLDVIYKLMTDADKQNLIESTLSNVDNFRSLLRGKFKALAETYATKKVEDIQNSGKIDLADINSIL